MGSKEVKPKFILLLVEGSTEEIVYSRLLRKVFNMKSLNCKELPEPMKTIIEPLIDRLEKHFKCFHTIIHPPKSTYTTIFNCQGYEKLINYLRLIIKRRELAEALEKLEASLAVAADKDKNPIESVKSVLNSLKLNFKTITESILEINLQREKLKIHVIEQGSIAAGATGQIEDILADLIEKIAEKRAASKELITTIKNTNSLTTKQKFIMYLTLLDPRAKTRKLLKNLSEILEDTKRETLRQELESLTEKLDKILTS